MADGRDDDFRRERQRRDDHPRCDSAIVWAKRRPAGHVAVKLPVHAANDARDPARTISGGEAPTMLTVALKASWVPDRVLLLHKRCVPAVFEVVAFPLAHERVANATEVDPEVRELVREQRPGVEQLAAVDFFPLISGAVRVVTF